MKDDTINLEVCDHLYEGKNGIEGYSTVKINGKLFTSGFSKNTKTPIAVQLKCDWIGIIQLLEFLTGRTVLITRTPYGGNKNNIY